MGDFLRQSNSLQEENASSEEDGTYRKTSLHQIAQLRGANAGRRRMIEGGRTPAKPRWSEVIIFWMFSSGREALRRRKKNATIFQVILYSLCFSIVKYTREGMQNNNRAE